MFERSKRSLSDKEKKALIVKGSSIERQAKGFFRRLPIVMVAICGALWGGTMLVAKASAIVIMLVWLCIGTVISLWIILEEKQKLSKRIKSIEEALGKNEAEVVRIKSSAMVEFEEIEDEGTGYAFQIADESIVFVEGQDFYPSAKFPNDDFEIIYIYDAAGNLVEMLIEKHGNKLKPLQKISVEVKKRLRIFSHLEMAKGKLADLEHILASR